jgi:uncharacterized protein YjbI with pentapeptide repeats
VVRTATAGRRLHGRHSAAALTGAELTGAALTRAELTGY